MTNARVGFWILVLTLVSVGLGLAMVRHVELEIPFLPGNDRDVWLVEARIDLVAEGESLRVSLDLPDRPPGFRLFTEQAASSGYGFAVLEDNGDRRGEWTRREARGNQTLYYTAQFIVDPRQELTPVQGEPVVNEVYFEQPAETAADELISRALARSSSAASLTRELIRLLDPDLEQNAALLLGGDLGRAELLVRLLNRAGVAARVSLALELEDARRRRPLTAMIEVPMDGVWMPFHPQTGEQGRPDGMLFWHRGGTSLLDVEGGEQSQVTFSMLRQTVPALELSGAQGQDGLLADFGLSRLPIEEQGMFKMLFLLPMGALVVTFMRIIVGIRTAGTFMPVLIALAFVQTSLGVGLVGFTGIVAIGLVLRSYLSHLNLLLVARIAALVVIVILLISVLSLMGYHLGLSTGMTITFFPMIIIAWTIERMSILWEEEGPFEVLVQGGGSLLVAVLAYLLMQLQLVQHLTFNFPELNLVLLAVLLLLGQYTGYRLSELLRFGDLDEVAR